MTPNDTSSTPNASPGRPSRKLLLAAVAGLMGLGSAGCGQPDEPPPSQGEPDPEPQGAHVVSRSTVEGGLTFERFSADCEQRGGFVQTHAVCSGNNSCKGVSYNRFDYSLIEHTCKAINSCGGMSCVELPADSGKTGEEVYKNSCGPVCHSHTNTTAFVYYVAPGTNSDTARQQFLSRSRLYQQSIVAFGIHGVNADGVLSANMPAFHAKYSRKEIERVIDYVRQLELEVEAYEVMGPAAPVP
ncbi:c-type cytochrome [Cystobacter fuscus]|uniref:c-type cytochrome n=1 Tax=Cystobacter fuscus TaxID=43 RepID=UPI002B2FFF2F|nr:cytochrome c [Cystobacter fuscus]